MGGNSSDISAVCDVGHGGVFWRGIYLKLRQKGSDELEVPTKDMVRMAEWA